MDTYHAVVSKRDTRSFSAEPIPEPVLHKILQAACMAGSAKNAQPIRLIVLRDPARRAELAACGQFTPHVVSAPLVVALVLLPELGVLGAPFSIFRGPFDAGRAAQNMMLTAWESGVASCPASMHDAECARQVLRLPEGHTVANLIAFGFPVGRDANLGTRPRMPLEDFVYWEQWDGKNT